MDAQALMLEATFLRPAVHFLGHQVELLWVFLPLFLHQTCCVFLTLLLGLRCSGHLGLDFCFFWISSFELRRAYLNAPWAFHDLRVMVCGGPTSQAGLTSCCLFDPNWLSICSCSEPSRAPVCCCPWLLWFTRNRLRFRVQRPELRSWLLLALPSFCLLAFG